MKCGEEKPRCLNCERNGEPVCDYSIRLNWDGRLKRKGTSTLEPGESSASTRRNTLRIAQESSVNPPRRHVCRRQLAHYVQLDLLHPRVVPGESAIPLTSLVARVRGFLLPCLAQRIHPSHQSIRVCRRSLSCTKANAASTAAGSDRQEPIIRLRLSRCDFDTAANRQAESPCIQPIRH